jgi:hypothetical protein
MPANSEHDTEGQHQRVLRHEQGFEHTEVVFVVLRTETIVVRLQMPSGCVLSQLAYSMLQSKTSNRDRVTTGS